MPLAISGENNIEPCELTSNNERMNTIWTKRRVVVTGIGAVTPLGNDVETTWDNIKEGKSGIGPLTRLDADQFPAKVAAEVKDFDIEKYM